MVAVLREALTNVARHARASRVDVTAEASTSSVSLAVSDDGDGLGDVQRRSGLANLRQRAELHGGAFVLSSRASASSTRQEGTHLQWSIPLS